VSWKDLRKISYFPVMYVKIDWNEINKFQLCSEKTDISSYRVKEKIDRLYVTGCSKLTLAIVGRQKGTAFIVTFFIKS
jgi:hypothetical protein